MVDLGSIVLVGTALLGAAVYGLLALLALLVSLLPASRGRAQAVAATAAVAAAIGFVVAMLFTAVPVDSTDDTLPSVLFIAWIVAFLGGLVWIAAVGLRREAA